jgi:23S rRNA (cytidine1920-2'-O)/16S rRNA (cytidine1409-2'-O)-methyltransferase
VPKHLRLDAELVRRGLLSSRVEAKLAIEQGLVTVKGVTATRATTLVGADVPVAIAGTPRRFVSRGGDKLDGALARLEVPVTGRRWLDAGASTGGFTDRLLQGGAAQVIAVDVGYGQLDWKLRNDERVTVMERVNVRTLTSDDLPWRPEGVVADLSFISLRTVLDALILVAEPDADHLLMVKPQFEVGKDLVGKGGVVRDPDLWVAAMRSVVEKAASLGIGLAGATLSDVPGPAGNREFFLWLRQGADCGEDLLVSAAIEASGG